MLFTLISLSAILTAMYLSRRDDSSFPASEEDDCR